MPDAARRLLGALIGGAAGVGLTYLLAPMGIMLLAAAGGGVAMGAGAPRVPRSWPWAIGTTIVGLAVAIVVSWDIAPFNGPDQSLEFFVRNLGSTNAATKIGLGLTLMLGLAFGGGSGPPRRPAGPRDRIDEDEPRFTPPG